jgi:hypothetical protein
LGNVVGKVRSTIEDVVVHEYKGFVMTWNNSGGVC